MTSAIGSLFFFQRNFLKEKLLRVTQLIDINLCRLDAIKNES